MRQLLFLSGKGGTGKTSLAAAFAALTDEKVLADCDVDAANLHLLLDPTVLAEGEYSGSKEAVRDPARCTACGRCREVCRFHAIDEAFGIDPVMCEGCGACVSACPADAIELVPRVSGRWFTAGTRHGPLAGAELLPGEEVSGKLVMRVKEAMGDLATANGIDTALVDGSPGIGCPVIASISGVDDAILVTEPTRSGLHDLERILGVVRHFGIRAHLVINKADLSPELSEQIERFAADEELPVLGQIPYDRAVPAALIEGRSAVECEENPAGEAMRAIYERFARTTARQTPADRDREAPSADVKKGMDT